MRLYVCSIQTPECVRQVAEAVACNRAEAVLYPEVRFLTRAEVVAEWTADPLTSQQQDRLSDYISAEALVRLMPAGYDAANVTADELAQVAAFYDNTTGEITIISDTQIDDAGVAYQVLVHEMVHAYQDAAWDLGRLLETYGATEDRFLGLLAAVEGDAVLYQNFAAIFALGLSPYGVDWGRYFNDFQRVVLEAARQTETPTLDVSGLFPYAFGVEYVHAAWRDLDEEGIEAAVNGPPDSVRQVLRGYQGLPSPSINEDAELDPRAVPIISGFTFLAGGHRGIWLIEAMLQRTAGGSSLLPAFDLQPVTSDYFSAFRPDETGGVAIVWRVRGNTLNQLVDAPGSMWTPASFEDSRRVWTRVDGDLVLVAVSERMPMRAAAVLASIEGWRQPPQMDAEGLDGLRARSIADVPWRCALAPSIALD